MHKAIASYFTRLTGVDVLTTNRRAVLNNLGLVNITITCKTWPNTTSHFSQKILTTGAWSTSLHSWKQPFTQLLPSYQWSFHTGQYRRMTPTRRKFDESAQWCCCWCMVRWRRPSMKRRVHLYHVWSVGFTNYPDNITLSKMNHSVAMRSIPDEGSRKSSPKRFFSSKDKMP